MMDEGKNVRELLTRDPLGQDVLAIIDDDREPSPRVREMFDSMLRVTKLFDLEAAMSADYEPNRSFFLAMGEASSALVPEDTDDVYRLVIKLLYDGRIDAAYAMLIGLTTTPMFIDRRQLFDCYKHVFFVAAFNRLTGQGMDAAVARSFIERYQVLYKNVIYRNCYGNWRGYRNYEYLENGAALPAEVVAAFAEGAREEKGQDTTGNGVPERKAGEDGQAAVEPPTDDYATKSGRTTARQLLDPPEDIVTTNPFFSGYHSEEIDIMDPRAFIYTRECMRNPTRNRPETGEETDAADPWFGYAKGVLCGVTSCTIGVVYDELERAAATGRVDKAWRAAIGIASEKPLLIIPKRIIDLAKPEYVAKARGIVDDLDGWETAYGCYFNGRTFFHDWHSSAGTSPMEPGTPRKSSVA